MAFGVVHEQPPQAKGEAPSHSPSPSFLDTGLTMPWEGWSGAFSAGDTLEFRKWSVLSVAHPGLTIQKVRLTTAVQASLWVRWDYKGLP